MMTARAKETSADVGRPLLRCEKLCVGFEKRALLPAIDLEIASGQLWAVIGRNGSGKTTWLRTLLGLLPAVSGSVQHLAPNLKLSYLPQRKVIDELYPLLARDVVRMGLERRWSFLRPRLGGELSEIDQALEEMGVADLGSTPYRKLSEGQKQRVLFARLSVSRADLAVLDEPTSAMDQVAEGEAFELLDGLRRRRGLTIIVVSHYLGMVKRYADNAVLLDRESQHIVVGAPATVFKHEAFQARFSERPPPAAESGG